MPLALTPAVTRSMSPARRGIGSLASLCTVALLTGLMLSGCAGSTPAGNDGSKLTGTTEARILAGEEAPIAGAGAIRGKVLDDAGFALEGAFVSILTTPLKATTDVNGSFGFANVTPDELTLRVVADTYRVHEGQVDVKADSVTEVTVTLVPVNNRGPGYRQHLHDYWGDLNELDLMDRSLDWSRSGSYSAYGPAGQAVTGTVWANQATWWLYFGIPERADSRPPIVLPGTAQIKMTATWDNSVEANSFVLSFHNGDFKWRNQQPLAKGKEIVVDLEGGDPDNGHQMFSLWGFRIQPTGRTPPNVILGEIQVKMTMVKGDVEAEPGHEDFWEANTTYLSRTYATPTQGASICCVESYVRAYMDAGRLVPPGTDFLSVRFGAASNRAPGTPHDLDWDLLVKPANLHPSAPASDYRKLTPNGTAAGIKSYVIPVPPGETDAYYQRSSNWIFMIRQATADWPMGVAEYDHKFNLEIIAHKDLTFV